MKAAQSCHLSIGDVIMNAAEIVVVLVLLGGPMAVVTAWSLRFRSAVGLGAVVCIAAWAVVAFQSEEQVLAVSDRPLYQAGQAMEDYADREFPTDARLAADPSTVVGQVIGRVIALAAVAFMLGSIYWAPSAAIRRMRTARANLAHHDGDA